MADCKNPQFLEWVKEMWDKARDHNSKGASTFKKAYDSLKACPITYEHPAQLTALVGFGPTICARLTKNLEELCAREGRPMPKKNKRKRKNDDEDGEEAESAPSPVKKSKSRIKQDYIPKFETGPYGIVLALATLAEDEGNGLAKAEVIEIAQPYCTASYTTPMNQGSFFTAWNGMKILIDKELVFAKGRPSTRYSLSDDGWDLAKRILASVDPSKGIHQMFKGKPAEDKDHDSFQDLGSEAERDNAGPSLPTARPGVPDVVAQGKVVTATSALPKVIPIMVEPGSFSVELVLDVREIRSKTDRDYMQNNLIKRGIKPIMKALDLGDVLWVAKLDNEHYLSQRGAEGSEVLLDYIVERKRLDDLVSSIKDRRFTEQKFRLEKSGVKNKIYIIEEYSSVDSNYDTHIATAIASTQVVNGFFVKKTQRMDDTIDYLVRMTHMLKKKFESSPLRVIPTNIITTGNYLPLLSHLAATEPRKNYHITFNAFSSLSSKSDSLTLRDVFLKMLMCTRGLTGEKAIEIQKRWQTPNALAQTYREIERREGGGEQARKVKRELLWREMGGLVGRRKIQKALSAKVADVWGEWEGRE